MPQTETMTLNMGPQHPSTHGVLQVILELDGEYVVKATPHIGFLHRGVEKLSETKRYHQIIPITDRMDYLSGFTNNLGYVLAVEKLLDIQVPPRAEYIRVILAELTRISSHLFWLGTHALDLGAMTPLFYCMREREHICDIFEMVSGARMTPSFVRIGGLADDFPDGLTEKVWEFIEIFPEKLSDYETLLTKIPIWIGRTKDVGVISAADAISFGLTGPVLRGSNVKWDVRKSFPYSGYENFMFDIPIGENGDTYDRYLVRLEEMRQSINIVRQALVGLPQGEINAYAPKVVLPRKQETMSRMDALIRHFKLIEEGMSPPQGEVYTSIESARGELGYYIVSDGGTNPYRLRIRPPSFVNLQALPKLIEGRLLADVVAIIGSIDIVLGEVDR